MIKLVMTIGIPFLAVLLLSLLAYLATRALIPWLVRRQVVDHPNTRGSHTRTIPRGGGVVIIVGGISLALVIAAFVKVNWVFVIAALWGAWALLGWIDDLVDVPASRRLWVQCLLFSPAPLPHRPHSSPPGLHRRPRPKAHQLLVAMEGERNFEVSMY